MQVFTFYMWNSGVTVWQGRNGNSIIFTSAFFLSGAHTERGILNQDLYRRETPQLKGKKRIGTKVTASSCQLMRIITPQSCWRGAHSSTITCYVTKKYPWVQSPPLLSLRQWLNASFSFLSFEETFHSRPLPLKTCHCLHNSFCALVSLSFQYLCSECICVLIGSALARKRIMWLFTEFKFLFTGPNIIL